MTLSESVRGERRVALEALRDTLAASIEAVDAKDRAPLANQLRQVLAELADLPDGKQVSKVDDLASRRASRRAAAAGQ